MHYRPVRGCRLAIAELGDRSKCTNLEQPRPCAGLFRSSINWQRVRAGPAWGPARGQCSASAFGAGFNIGRVGWREETPPAAQGPAVDEHRDSFELALWHLNVEPSQSVD